MTVLATSSSTLASTTSRRALRAGDMPALAPDWVLSVTLQFLPAAPAPRAPA